MKREAIRIDLRFYYLWWTIPSASPKYKVSNSLCSCFSYTSLLLLFLTHTPFFKGNFWFQADMHFCAAKCCQDQTSSIDSVQGCVERCSAPLNKAQRYVHTELEGFQGRLQRCVMVIFFIVKSRFRNKKKFIRIYFSAMQWWYQKSNATITIRNGGNKVHQPVRTMCYQM